MSTDETPQPSPTNPDNSNRWAKARRTFTLLYALAMVASAAGLIVVWYGWDPVWGPAVQNLITYSLILLACLMTAGWLIVFSPFRWKTVLMILGIAAFVVTGAAACVRTFEFDGDMGIVAHYRWERRLKKDWLRIAKPQSHWTSSWTRNSLLLKSLRQTVRGTAATIQPASSKARHYPKTGRRPRLDNSGSNRVVAATRLFPLSETLS